jgi:hypothetical protein
VVDVALECAVWHASKIVDAKLQTDRQIANDAAAA